ncbi:dihydrodipicolinate synthase family protein [Corynebacterium kutscheri]|uniref:Dihydrodipicolinate synthase n=1 Tax=Corynebacterium kutscheri TaxID=35755 RepID=A0A0F6TD23_9CORY|nr:dihydrodipicolinate synthase family protein [Corynebacterium kutscheri]AKE40859.1 dihydrodipicolinate synthase/N-acetylneuraminate lyase [Corynebacterium kutscheri]VEH06600.1 dihydrodipicolinate synthase [Corynebacterium kutscheri]VEH09156.1 dihydrodipicolinate synthase [Corynebacterium kutscheri]
MIDAKFHIALPTAFYEDESLNIEATLAHADFCLSQGVESVLLCGSTGEQHCLEVAEKIALIDAIDKHPFVENTQIIFGIADIRLHNALTVAQRIAQSPHIDAVLLGFPPYIRPTQDEALRYASAILTAANKPAIIYNNPVRTGFDANAETLARLCLLPDVIGIKDPGGAPKIAELNTRLAPFKPLYFAGGEIDLPTRIADGYNGLSSIVGNLAPHQTKAWFEALKKDLPEKDELNKEIQPLIHRIFSDSPLPAIKDHITRHEEIPMGVCRSPLGMY